MLQHKLNSAGHLPEIIFNICAKKIISFEIAVFGRVFLFDNSRNALSDADSDNTIKFDIFLKNG